MTEIPASNPSTPPKVSLGAVFLSTPVIAFALALFLSLVIAKSTLPPAPADTVLGPFFGGLLLALLIAPALIAANNHCHLSLLTTAAIFLAIAIAWTLTIIQTPATPSQLLQCIAILAAWLIAIFGTVSLLRAIRIPPSIAAAAVVIIGLAWLSWPVWLSPYLPGQSAVTFADRLIAPSPIFATNAVLQREGGWTTSPIAYHLISLGQDVPYSMPNNITWCVTLHLLIGATTFALALLLNRNPRSAS